MVATAKVQQIDQSAKALSSSAAVTNPSPPDAAAVTNPSPPDAAAVTSPPPDAAAVTSPPPGDLPAVASGHGKRKLDDSGDQETKKMKKKKKNATITPVSVFDVRTVALKPVIKSSKCNIVPIRTVDDETILVQLSGGGRIPKSFGVDVEKSMDDGRTKVNLNFNIDDTSDFMNLQRIWEDLSTVSSKNWKSWHPDASKVPSRAILQEFCYPLAKEGKKKRNSDERYPACLKVGLDVDTMDVSKCPKCTIVNSNTSDAVSYTDLGGMIWTKIIIEFRHIFILANKSHGITKKIRYIECCDDEGLEGDIVPI